MFGGVYSWDQLVMLVFYAAFSGGVIGGITLVVVQWVTSALAAWFFGLPVVLDWHDRRYVRLLNTAIARKVSPARQGGRIDPALLIPVVVLVMVLTGCGASVSAPPSLWSDKEHSMHDQWIQRIKTGRW